MELAHFTGEPAASLIPENLYYAKQWKENLNLLRLGCVDWICFYDLPSTNERHVDLNIHHTYYIEGKDAWDYDNSALQTLCIDCHQKEHQTKSFPIYEDHKQLQVLKDAKFCMRCDGSGYLPQFNYYLDGVCFSCGGDGVILD